VKTPLTIGRNLLFVAHRAVSPVTAGCSRRCSVLHLRLRRIFLWGRLKTCAPVGNRRSFLYPRDQHPRDVWSRLCCSVGQAILPAAAFQAALRRVIILALLASATSFGAEFVQAVEFPYYHHPRILWERELVWLKNIGIRTVAFSVGQSPPKTDPRSDLPGFLKILRRLGLRAWIYEVPRDLAPMLAMQLEQHGGPIAFVEGPSDLESLAPPAPITRLSATDPGALLRSREAFTGGHGSLLWQDVEDTLSPGLKRGVVSFSGDERPGATALRRNAGHKSGCAINSPIRSTT